MKEDKKLNIEEFELDISIFETKVEGREFAKKLKENKDKAAIAFRVFIQNIGTEAKETHQASKVIVKFVKLGKVSKEEELELKTQVYDMLKMMGVGIPFFLIPGSSLLLPFLIKFAEKRGVNILPSAFSNNEIKNNDPKDSSNPS